MRFGLSLVRAGVDESDPLPPDHDRPSGEAAALETLYRRERSGLVGFVARKAGFDDAEDIVQQVFARFVARVNAETLEKPGPYLRQCAHNHLVDRVRVAVRRGHDSHVPIEEVSLADSDPIAMLEARDRLRRIEEALTRLKPLTRQIFLACRVDGFSHAEIAKQTGLSVKGVEKHMGKAIKHLGRHLRP